MESDKTKSIKLGEVYGLMKLNDKILAKRFEWSDIGNLRALSSAKNIINKNSLKYNILEKNDEKIWFVNNKVIKYFKDDKIVKKRVKRSLNLKNYIPRILGKKNNLYCWINNLIYINYNYFVIEIHDSVCIFFLSCRGIAHFFQFFLKIIFQNYYFAFL